MGTNFYADRLVAPRCDHCGRGDDIETLHIGKSSAGWVFSLHVMPERGIHDLSDWLPIFETATIRDEYGDTLSKDQMVAQITKRRGRNEWGASENWRGIGYLDEAHFHELNSSERGPHGLLRHRVGRYCRSHGAGTWDCIEGEFS